MILQTYYVEAIVCGTDYHNVYCLDGTTGNLIWTTNTGGCNAGSVADVDKDGKI